MRRLTRLTLASLLLTLSTSSSSAQQSEHGLRYFNDSDLEKISQQIIKGEKCEATQFLTNEALAQCHLDIEKTQPQFWQKPTFIAGGFVITVSVTALAICLTHTFGACQ